MKPDYFYDYARAARRVRLEDDQRRRAQRITRRNYVLLWSITVGGLVLLAILEGVI